MILNKEQVIQMHEQIVNEFGGSLGVRDMNLLDSALKSVFVTFNGKELYPTNEEKAARLAYGLVSNHAFVDGNKRIAMHIMTFFLEFTGVKIEYTSGELIAVGIALASGKMNYTQLLQWIIEHKEKK
jgi:death-on-curing protein